MISSLKDLGCNMSIKVHYLHSYLDHILKNLGDLSEKQGERFHQGKRVMQERCQGRWDVTMQANYCWSLQTLCPDYKHSRKFYKKNAFRCYALMLPEENIEFCAVYCYYWITLLLKIALTPLQLASTRFVYFLAIFKASFFFMTHTQQIKIRTVGADHVSKTRTDAKKLMLFSKSAPQIYPKTVPFSEAPNCVLTSVISKFCYIKGLSDIVH